MPPPVVHGVVVVQGHCFLVSRHDIICLQYTRKVILSAEGGVLSGSQQFFEYPYLVFHGFTLGEPYLFADL